jgi:hypothetical protein
VKISAKLSVVLAAIFASVCYGVAIQGFMALGTLEGQVRDDALGVWIVYTGKEEDA